MNLEEAESTSEVAHRKPRLTSEVAAKRLSEEDAWHTTAINPVLLASFGRSSDAAFPHLPLTMWFDKRRAAAEVSDPL